MIRIEDATCCSECGSEQLLRDDERGEVVCQACGFIVSDLGLFQDPAPRGLADRSLMTEISGYDRDHAGKALSAHGQARAYRLRKWQRRMRTYRSTHRNASSAYREIDRICQAMDLPLVVQVVSKEMYDKTLDMGYTLGRPMDILVTSIVYSACRLSHVPRTLKEFSDSTGIDRKSIGRSQVRLARDLSLQLPQARPADFLDRFCSRLQLSDETRNEARRIITVAEECGLLSGRDPCGLAAASIYIATNITGQVRTQSEVESFTGITQVTIRKRCKELYSIDGSWPRPSASPP